MTIDEAIEALNGLVWNGTAAWSTNTAKATLLGIEAMKRVKDSRVQRLADFTNLLPGETEE